MPKHERHAPSAPDRIVAALGHLNAAIAALPPFGSDDLIDAASGYLVSARNALAERQKTSRPEAG